MTSLLFFQRLLPLLSLYREPVLPRDVPQGPEGEGANKAQSWVPDPHPYPPPPTVGQAEPSSRTLASRAAWSRVG